MDEPTATVLRLERALRERPLDVALHHRLGGAHKALIEGPSAEAALAEITREVPMAYTSLLHLARHVELRGDTRGAIIGYTRAIRTAQTLGFWYAEASTPPWLVQLVLHGMQLAHHGRIELFQAELETWRARYGPDEVARVAEGLAMWLGIQPLERADPRQQPSFFYLPGLPVHPVFPRDTLTFADWYESETDAIAHEMQRILDDTRPFHYDVPEAQRDQLTTGGWDAYFFYADGEREDAHHAACPHTSSVLARLPLDHVRDHGPEVCFSVMRPGARILPHRGVTNTRAVLHLGLDIPDGCALHLVGVQEVHWQRGACFAFDDTFEHEAWNRGDRTRVVLLGDIWNPFLRAAEREIVASIVASIGDFNRACDPR
jgi:aspartate beta-hydroxylase